MVDGLLESGPSLSLSGRFYGDFVLILDGEWDWMEWGLVKS